MKEDRRKYNGGNKNAGRKSKAEELQALYIIKKAIRVIYKKDDDEAAKIAFLKDFATSQKGQQFIAEHLFGKPKDVVQNVNINYDAGEITEKEAKTISKALESEY